ncbi:protein SCAF11 isoform X2 [Triplophysa rosa]|uniref:protein SCAF11 isoform X2 n=1 Tax=Triplophysa rosa TaxID=992332 RepID=UPI00254624C1|nr:protein SCAF11 isoform X2 [Triplophysa rosa]
MREGPGKDGQSSEDEAAQRCPICLNRPRRADRAVPDCCTHVYCSACILRWAQMVQSCPVDRRPFSVIYLQGFSQLCIKLPVKVSKLSEPHMCSGQDAQRMCHVCVDKTEETKRMQEKRVDGKQKRHIRKCDSDKFVHKNRKMSGDSCRALLRSQHVHSSLPSRQGASVGTVTHIITESVEVCEELPDDVQWSRLERKPRWLPAFSPAISTGFPRVSLHSHLLLSAASASLNLLLSEHSVPYGRVCAVTCPKGEERKGTRGSKSSAKPTQAVATRRSSRHTRTESEDTAGEQSQATDSDASSSTNHSTTPQTANNTHASTSRDPQENNQRTKTKGRAKKTSLVERHEEEEEQEAEPENHEEEAVSKKEESEETEGDQEQKEAQRSHQANSDPQPTDPEQKMEEENEKSCGENEKSCGENEKSCGENEKSCDENEKSCDENEKSCDENENSCDENEQISPDVNQHEEETNTVEEEVSMNTDEHEDNQTLSQGDMLENKPIVEKCDENQEEPLNVSPVKEDGVLLSCVEPESASQNDESVSVEPTAELSADTSNIITDLKHESDITTENTDADLKQESSSLPPVEDQSTYPSDQLLPLVTQENATSECLDTKARSPQDNTDLIPMECDSPPSENEVNAAAEKDANVPQIPSQDPTPDPKTDSCKDLKDLDKKEGRARRSRFHSPTTTWSPSRESRNEGSRRSRSRSRDRSSTTRSTSSSREQHEDKQDCKRNRSRSRERSRSKERSHRRRSRSRSRTRNQANCRSPSQEHVDHTGHSPHKRESWGGDGWRSRGGGKGFRNSNWWNDSEKPSHFSARAPISSNNGNFNEASPDRGRSENPDWVREREMTYAEADTRGREPRREENTSDPPAESWSRGGWNMDQGQRSAGRGRGAHWSSSQQGDPADNWRQRNSFSGTSNNIDSYNRFNENRAGVKRKEPEGSDMPMDRSGWSSASSWAVRRTLPADVQSYYSRRDRGGAGNVWNRQEEEQSASGPSKQDPPQNQTNTPLQTEAVPQPLPTLMPPQLGMLGVLRYPMPSLVPRPPVPGLQPAQFSMPPPVPVHLHPTGPLHPAGPLLQVQSIAVQGLPPPPPPPPPVQQGGFTTVPAESHTSQVMPNFSVPGKASFKPMPTKAGTAVPQPAGTLSVAQPSSTTPQPSSHSKAHADSSKKEKKLQIQERAINEVKAAIKPYYQKNEITKEEYKEIVRKAVEKVCHSKSGEVNADKVSNLVKAYVDKYKRIRKNKSE